jgi:2-phosphosulfolactate phosphatase
MSYSALKIDWSIYGLEYALRRKDIVIIVDTLRFSTSTVTAVANGFTIYAASDSETGAACAKRFDAILSGKPGEARFTISPSSYVDVKNQENRKVVLYSPNGAACAEMIKGNSIAYIGCFLNAKAVAEHVCTKAVHEKKDVTIIAAGEQRSVDTGERIVYEKNDSYRVFAVEDYLAAGAIISYSHIDKNPETKVCERAFITSKHDLEDLLMYSFSGRYLLQHGLKSDVQHAAQLNTYNIVPRVKNGVITITH